MTGGHRYALIIVLAVAMGVQNATARRLAVPDLTTTVLTLTITGIAADSAIAGGKRSLAGRRLLAVLAMLLGALVGAVCVVYVHAAYPLLIGLIVLFVVALAARRLGTPKAARLHAISLMFAPMDGPGGSASERTSS